MAVIFCLTDFSPRGFAAAPSEALPGANPAASVIFSIAKAAVPAEFGSIEEKFQGKPDGLTVIYLSDAHAVPEAQKSLFNLIGFFQDRYGIKTTALEGTKGKYDPALFRSFPDPQQLKKVFNATLESGELSGAVAASILHSQDADYIGIEDWKLYEEGISAFLKALDQRTGLVSQISRLETELQGLKNKVYSPKALELDARLQAWRKNPEELSPLLKTFAGIREPDGARYPSLQAILNSLVQEDLQDPGALDREILALAAQVRPLFKSREQIRAFSEKLQAFKTQRLGRGEFALFLQSFSSAVDAPASSQLQELIEHQARLQQMQGHIFLKEFQEYGQEIKAVLLPSPEAKRIDAMGRTLELLQKLVNLELSPEEWRELCEIATPPSEARDDKDKKRLENLDAQILQTLTSDALAPARRFYDITLKRDQAFHQNLHKLAAQKKIKTLLLIGGGFHAEGLKERFQKEGTSFLIIHPKMESLPEENHYQNYMQGRVSWRDYFKVEGGRIDLRAAFSRSEVDRLLKPGDDSSSLLLKAWRDQLLRNLFSQGRIAESGKYTRFLDEKLALTIPDEVVNSYKSRWSGNLERFLQGLHLLQKQGQLSETGIAQLLTKPASLHPYAIPNHAIPAAWLDVSRSEARASGERLDAELVPRLPARGEARMISLSEQVVDLAGENPQQPLSDEEINILHSTLRTIVKNASKRVRALESDDSQGDVVVSVAVGFSEQVRSFVQTVSINGRRKAFILVDRAMITDGPRLFIHLAYQLENTLNYFKNWKQAEQDTFVETREMKIRGFLETLVVLGKIYDGLKSMVSENSLPRDEEAMVRQLAERIHEEAFLSVQESLAETGYAWPKIEILRGGAQVKARIDGRVWDGIVEKFSKNVLRPAGFFTEAKGQVLEVRLLGRRTFISFDQDPVTITRDLAYVYPRSEARQALADLAVQNRLDSARSEERVSAEQELPSAAELRARFETITDQQTAALNQFEDNLATIAGNNQKWRQWPYFFFAFQVLLAIATGIGLGYYFENILIGVGTGTTAFGLLIGADAAYERFLKRVDPSEKKWLASRNQIEQEERDLIQTLSRKLQSHTKDRVSISGNLSYEENLRLAFELLDGVLQGRHQKQSLAETKEDVLKRLEKLRLKIESVYPGNDRFKISTLNLIGLSFEIRVLQFLEALPDEKGASQLQLLENEMLGMKNAITGAIQNLGSSSVSPVPALRSETRITKKRADDFFDQVRKTLEKLPGDLGKYKFGYEFKTAQEVKAELGPIDAVMRSVLKTYQDRGFMVGPEDLHSTGYWIDPASTTFRFSALLELIKKRIGVSAGIYDAKDLEEAVVLLEEKLGGDKKDPQAIFGLEDIAAWRDLEAHAQALDSRSETRAMREPATEAEIAETVQAPGEWFKRNELVTHKEIAKQLNAHFLANAVGIRDARLGPLREGLAQKRNISNEEIKEVTKINHLATLNFWRSGKWSTEKQIHELPRIGGKKAILLARLVLGWDETKDPVTAIGVLMGVPDLTLAEYEAVFPFKGRVRGEGQEKSGPAKKATKLSKYLDAKYLLYNPEAPAPETAKEIREFFIQNAFAAVRKIKPAMYQKEIIAATGASQGTVHYWEREKEIGSYTSIQLSYALKLAHYAAGLHERNEDSYRSLAWLMKDASLTDEQINTIFVAARRQINGPEASLETPEIWFERRGKTLDWSIPDSGTAKELRQLFLSNANRLRLRFGIPNDEIQEVTGNTAGGTVSYWWHGKPNHEDYTSISKEKALPLAEFFLLGDPYDAAAGLFGEPTLLPEMIDLIFDLAGRSARRIAEDKAEPGSFAPQPVSWPAKYREGTASFEALPEPLKKAGLENGEKKEAQGRFLENVFFKLHEQGKTIDEIAGHTGRHPWTVQFWAAGGQMRDGEWKKATLPWDKAVQLARLAQPEKETDLTNEQAVAEILGHPALEREILAAIFPSINRGTIETEEPSPAKVRRPRKGSGEKVISWPKKYLNGTAKFGSLAEDLKRPDLENGDKKKAQGLFFENVFTKLYALGFTLEAIGEKIDYHPWTVKWWAIGGQNRSGMWQPASIPWASAVKLARLANPETESQMTDEQAAAEMLGDPALSSEILAAIFPSLRSEARQALADLAVQNRWDSARSEKRMELLLTYWRFSNFLYNASPVLKMGTFIFSSALFGLMMLSLTGDLHVFVLPYLALISVLVHEFSHAWAAEKMGDETAREWKTLKPWKQFTIVGFIVLPLFGFYYGRVPFSLEGMTRWQKTGVLLAGPASNLALAALFFTADYFSGASSFLRRPDSPLWAYGVHLMWLINSAIVLINLIPWKVGESKSDAHQILFPSPDPTEAAGRPEIQRPFHLETRLQELAEGLSGEPYWPVIEKKVMGFLSGISENTEVSQVEREELEAGWKYDLADEKIRPMGRWGFTILFAPYVDDRELMSFMIDYPSARVPLWWLYKFWDKTVKAASKASTPDAPQRSELRAKQPLPVQEFLKDFWSRSENQIVSPVVKEDINLKIKKGEFNAFSPDENRPETLSEHYQTRREWLKKIFFEYLRTYPEEGAPYVLNLRGNPVELHDRIKGYQMEIIPGVQGRENPEFYLHFITPEIPEGVIIAPSLDETLELLSLLEETPRAPAENINADIRVWAIRVIFAASALGALVNFIFLGNPNWMIVLGGFAVVFGLITGLIEYFNWIVRRFVPADNGTIQDQTNQLIERHESEGAELWARHLEMKQAELPDTGIKEGIPPFRSEARVSEEPVSLLAFAKDHSAIDKDLTLYMEGKIDRLNLSVIFELRRLIQPYLLSFPLGQPLVFGPENIPFSRWHRRGYQIVLTGRDEELNLITLEISLPGQKDSKPREVVVSMDNADLLSLFINLERSMSFDYYRVRFWKNMGSEIGEMAGHLATVIYLAIYALLVPFGLLILRELLDIHLLLNFEALHFWVTILYVGVLLTWVTIFLVGYYRNDKGAIEAIQDFIKESENPKMPSLAAEGIASEPKVTGSAENGIQPRSEARVRVSTAVARLKDRDWIIRMQAVQDLAKRGLEIKGVLPALLFALQDRALSVRVEAVKALVKADLRLYKEVETALLSALKDQEWYVRKPALEALQKADPEGKITVPALVEILKTYKEEDVPDSEGFQFAAEELGRMGIQAREAVPALVQVLLTEGHDFRIREKAATALDRINVPDEEILSLLRAALDDPARRERASRWIGEFSPQSKRAVRAREKDIRSETRPGIEYDQEKRWFVVRNSWGEMTTVFPEDKPGQTAKNLQSAIKQFLKDDDFFAEVKNEKTGNPSIEILKVEWAPSGNKTVTISMKDFSENTSVAAEALRVLGLAGEKESRTENVLLHRRDILYLTMVASNIAKVAFEMVRRKSSLNKMELQIKRGEKTTARVFRSLAGSQEKLLVDIVGQLQEMLEEEGRGLPADLTIKLEKNETGITLVALMEPKRSEVREKGFLSAAQAGAGIKKVSGPSLKRTAGFLFSAIQKRGLDDFGARVRRELALFFQNELAVKVAIAATLEDQGQGYPTVGAFLKTSGLLENQLAGFAEQIFEVSLGRLGRAIEQKEVTKLAPVLFYSPEIQPRLVRLVEKVAGVVESDPGLEAKNFRFHVIFEKKDQMQALIRALSPQALNYVQRYAADQMREEASKLESRVFRNPGFSQAYGVFFLKNEWEGMKSFAQQRRVRSDIPAAYASALLPELILYFGKTSTPDITAVSLKRAIPDFGAGLEFNEEDGVRILSAALKLMAETAEKFAVSA